LTSRHPEERAVARVSKGDGDALAVLLSQSAQLRMTAGLIADTLAETSSGESP